MSDSEHADRLPVYHGLDRSATHRYRADVLCRVLIAALNSYDGLSADIDRGKVDAHEYPTFASFDSYGSFSVIEITAHNARVNGVTNDERGLRLFYDSECVAGLADLAQAGELIEAASGTPVVLRAEHDGSGRRWLAQRRPDGDTEAISGPMLPAGVG